jgi:hypothetical protein
VFEFEPVDERDCHCLRVHGHVRFGLWIGRSQQRIGWLSVHEL